MSADVPQDGLTLFDPDRCRCLLGHCSNRATVDGLCDGCRLEYSAFAELASP